MPEPHTPTMHKAQDAYVLGSMSSGRYEGNRAKRRSEYRAEFHRMLAQVRAEAWDEAAVEARELDLVDGTGRNWLFDRNPYRQEATS